MKKVLITSINYPLPMSGKPGYVNGVRPIVLEKFISRGVLPILVSGYVTRDMADELYAICDGVVLSGGSDMDPKYYNQKKEEGTNVYEPLRDPLEFNLIERVLTDKKPVLGLCRGCQVIAVACGGTLHQNLGNMVTSETHGSGSVKSSTQVHEHVASVVPGTKLAKLLTTKSIRVTCNHHQGIDRVGANLVVSSSTKEGVIEVVEHIDPNFFCFGIQSHPETEEQGDLEILFDAFVQAVKQRA